MCIKNVVRRSGAFLSALVLCFALTVPALADELYSTTLILGGYRVNPDTDRVYSSSYTENELSADSSGLVYTGGHSCWPNGRYTSSSSSAYSGFGWSRFGTTATFSEGIYGLYLSGYYRSSTYAMSQNHAPSVDDFSLSFVSAATGVSSLAAVSSVVLFNPDYDGSASDGVTVSARFDSSVYDGVSSPYIFNGDGIRPSWYFVSNESDPTSVYGSKVFFYITSACCVAFESSGAADSLESMASEIAAQNSMLSAYYGDIVAVCNQIYQRLGDMQQTQIEANALLSSLVSLLDTTNGKISALNQAMSTYFELVLKSLENESLSIQDCINDAELRLETYLKPIVDYFTELEETTGESASSLPGHKTDLDKWSSDSTGIDDDAQAGLAAILPVLTAFSFIFQILSIFIGLGILGVIIRKGLS